MTTRTVAKLFGGAAATAAIALSAGVAVTAHADPEQAEPTPELQLPDAQGSGCDAFKKSLPNYKDLAKQPTGTALASIPDISTFNTAISGGMNPAVNIVPMLNNGPYVIFAPTNDAFAKLPPGELDALKADPAKLTKVLYYHEFLGNLGPNDLKGQRPTQEGTEVKVTGKGDDIKVNDDTKVLCGAVFSNNARIYLIDTVLDPAKGPEKITPESTSTGETTTQAPSGT